LRLVTSTSGGARRTPSISIFLTKRAGFTTKYAIPLPRRCVKHPLTALQRWGDAPVHSIGAALFARKDQVHFFSDIGYRHEPFQHCPQGDAHKRGKCWCDPSQNFGSLSLSCVLLDLHRSMAEGSTDYEWYSCLSRYDKLF
jgi:hypothetical protein